MVLASFFIPVLWILPGLATQHNNNPHRHRGVARNLELQKKDENINLSKRSFTGRMTYYPTGQGACGGWNSPGDFIVALNSAQYGDGYPGPQCWKWITISYGGKTHSAQIVDSCPTCNEGDLDMSESLFTYFESTETGMFTASWWFNDGPGGGGDQPTSTSQTQEPTSQPPPPPETTTSTWAPPPETTLTHEESTSTSSTWSETTTLTSTSISSSSETLTSSSSTSASSTSTSSTENAEPTGAVVGFPQALLNLGRVLAAGATIQA